MSESKLALGVRLRKEGKLEQSRVVLLEHAEGHPEDSLANYQCAWANDVLGREREAIPFYARAIAQGLAGKDLEGAFIGLGSSFRCIGRYDESVETLQRGLVAFPANRTLQVFLAMALYNVGRHKEAMEVLLKNLVETSGDASIAEYRNALSNYAGQLDKTW